MNWVPITSIFTILAFYVAWAAFYIERTSKLRGKREEKIDILKSIEKELSLMGSWLGENYNDANYTQLQDPWHPFHMVYGLVRNDAIKNAISLKSVSLLSNDLLEALVAFNQKMGGFEQHVNRMVQFNTSDPIIATKAFYYYDSTFAKYSRPKKWLEFEKLAKKLFTGKRLLPEEIHLVGSVRILKDLHVIGIGDENNPTHLRFSYVIVRDMVRVELAEVSREKLFRQPRLFSMLDALVAFSFVALLVAIPVFTVEGGVLIKNMNSISFLLPLISIIAVSIFLGLIKYASIASKYIGTPWQSKFAEIWNDTLNFLLAGLVGYYFVLVRLPKLLAGESVGLSDFVLFFIFAMGMFGHLCVLSKNTTEGVQAIMEKIIGRH